MTAVAELFTFGPDTMSNGDSLMNLGDISKPATVLIEKISEAIGGVFKPYQIRRVAQAEADAELFRKLCSFGLVHVGNIITLVYDVSAGIYTKAGLSFTGLTQLDHIGLIRFESLTGFSNTGLPQKTVVFYYDTQVMVQFPKPEGNTLDLGHVMLSKAGQELAPICGSERHAGFLDYVVETLQKQNLKIEVHADGQGAAPKGGPATPVGNSGVTEASPSVS